MYVIIYIYMYMHIVSYIYIYIFGGADPTARPQGLGLAQASASLTSCLGMKPVSVQRLLELTRVHMEIYMLEIMAYGCPNLQEIIPRASMV